MAYRELSMFWRIENFSILAYYPLVQSAAFNLRCSTETNCLQKFHIYFHLASPTNPDGTVELQKKYFFMKRSNENRLPKIRVSFFALLASGEYIKFHDGGRVRNGIEVDECRGQYEDYRFLTENRISHLPNDSLTFLVRFSSRQPVFEANRLFARTAVPYRNIKTEWVIADPLNKTCKTTVNESFIDLKLETAQNSNEDAYEVVVRPRNIAHTPIVCDILLKKESGERIVIEDFAVIRGEPKTFVIKKELCEKHAQEALRESGSLSLYFEFRTRNFSPVPLEFQATPFDGFVDDSPDALRNATDAKITGKRTDTKVDLQSDLRDLYSLREFCDFTLRAGGRSFPVHRNILSARSAVFRGMLEADMRERRENCAEVPDLDADTMDRMLRFLYSAEFGDLNVGGTSRLFAAADKYQIESLRSRCVESLVVGLTAENVCRVLSLAVKHSDRTLMAGAKRFVLWNSDLVFRTEGWKRFAAENQQVASDFENGTLLNQQA